MHNNEEARRILNLAIREHPKSAEPLAALGDFEIQQQTYDAAIGHLKASLALVAGKRGNPKPAGRRVSGEG